MSQQPYQDEFDTKSNVRTIVNMADHEGELILFTPTEYIPLVEGDETSGIPTVNGRKDAVITDMVIVRTGEVFDDVMILQGHLVGDLKRRVETKRKRLGVLGRGPAKQKGWNQPWIIVDPTDEQVQQARDFLAGRTVAQAVAPVADDPFAV